MLASAALIGVPSSAGAHHAGQELAPAVLRAFGLLGRLRAAGLDIVDRGDVDGEVFRVDHTVTTARNLDAVVRVAERVADAVEHQVRSGRFPIVVGGDCTITIGVICGLQRIDDEVRLAYFDGDADLNAPARTRSGILDSSGVAHLLGIADTRLAHLGRRFPMLRPDQIALLGYDPSDPDSFDGSALAARPTLLHFSEEEMRGDPVAAAQAAVGALARGGHPFAVHFDVDAVESGDLPLGNFPHYGTGVPLETAVTVLATLLAAPGAQALVLTEVNPTHDPWGTQLERYVDAVGSAIGTALHPGSDRSAPSGAAPA